MNDPADDEVDKFLQALVGERPAAPLEAALRSELLQFAEASRQADAVAREGISAQDLARRDAMAARLVALGHLRAPESTPVSTSMASARPTQKPAQPNPSLAARIRAAFWGDDWLRPVAFASVLGFGLLIGKQITPPRADLGYGAERRIDAPAELTLIATDAGAEANALVERLTKQGLQAQAVQIGLQPPRWTIRVTAESDADQAKARQVLLGDALSKRQLRVDILQASTPTAASGAASR